MPDPEVHPAAEIFPMMSAEEYRELVNDIRENGQRVAITYWGGQLLDGRNRHKACLELGIEPDEEELDEDLVPDPVAWVLSTNLHRRHLTTSQRAMIAGRVATIRHGGDRQSEEFKGSNEPSSNEAAGKQLKVGRATVKRAKSVIKGGCVAVVDAVDAGHLTVSLAEKLVRHFPKHADQERLVDAGAEAIREAIAEQQRETSKKPKPAKPFEQARDEICGSSADEYEDVECDEEADDTSPLTALHPIIHSLDQTQLIVVREWIDALMPADPK